jgi:membrane fusion protein (multidrug efflux system)
MTVNLWLKSGFPIFLAATGLLAASGCKKASSPPPAPAEVQFITVQPRDMPIYEDWIGALDGFVNAGIRAQVTGYLQAQNYQEGSRVKKGDPLFQIDARPFQAVLDQARAKLAQTRAQAQKTALDVQRYTPLAKDQALSQEELDNAVQAELAAQAQVKADEASLETAQLNLEFTKVTSPVDGLAGLALAQVGDLVSLSSGLLTTVSQIDPIKVFFNVSEQSYLTFWRDHIQPQNGDGLALKLVLSDGSIYPLAGKVFFADRQVNQNTGTLQIIGTFPNPDYILRPGQYGRVRAQTQLKRGVLVVPQRAVAELQGSYQVAVVVDDNQTNKTHLQAVKVGEQVGAEWIIEEGLHSGDRVVVEGTQKAKEGTVVIPKPFLPSSSTNSAATNQPTAL